MDSRKEKQEEMSRKIAEMREQRKLKEKARIEKLRDMNMKKYKTEETKSVFQTPRQLSINQSKTNEQPSKNMSSVKIAVQKPAAPQIQKKVPTVGTPTVTNQQRKSLIPVKSQVLKKTPEPVLSKAVMKKAVQQKSSKPIKPVVEKKDEKPKMSVFERLYNSKSQPIPSTRRQTIFEHKNNLVAAHANRRSMAPVAVVKENVKKMRQSVAPVANVKENPTKIRRSISAVHFKRIGKEELKNCFIRHTSFSDGLNKIDIKLINDEDKPQIVNSIKSERKKVKFQTGTPRVEELETKLNDWLRKHGKSQDSFRHLRCFGIHQPNVTEMEAFDDENKENIEVSLSDDGSFSELMNEDDAKTKWRRASLFNDSEVNSDCAEGNKSLVSAETPLPKPRVNEVLLSALWDLSQLIREGYDWEQSARWLRAIRERCPEASGLAAYWECRAALEECRGNLPRSCLCWEEAIAKGSEASKAEASIDQLLDKFMQLNISPGKNDVKPSVSEQEIMCAKNVFKTSLIRFAVKNAKAKSETAKYTITPVRRSMRASMLRQPTPVRTPGHFHSAKRTPLVQIASSICHIDQDIREESVFVPNKLLQFSP